MAANIRIGRRVNFVGGPEAGNTRIIPESAGETIKSGDWVYRIIAMALRDYPGKTLYFAYDAQKHPFGFLQEMWHEYAPAATIKRKTSV